MVGTFQEMDGRKKGLCGVLGRIERSRLWSFLCVLFWCFFIFLISLFSLSFSPCVLVSSYFRSVFTLYSYPFAILFLFHSIITHFKTSELLSTLLRPSSSHCRRLLGWKSSLEKKKKQKLKKVWGKMERSFRNFSLSISRKERGCDWWKEVLVMVGFEESFYNVSKYGTRIGGRG